VAMKDIALWIVSACVLVEDYRGFGIHNAAIVRIKLA
jgi:hypothetical protein